MSDKVTSHRRFGHYRQQDDWGGRKRWEKTVAGGGWRASCDQNALITDGRRIIPGSGKS